MRRLLISAALAAALFSPAVLAPAPAAAACYGSTHVSGYYRADGTYVPGHYRSCPDSSTSNNASGWPSPRDASGHIDIGAGIPKSPPWSSGYSGYDRFYP